MPHRSLPPIVALLLLLTAAVFAAVPVDREVSVPISVITSKDLADLPSCGRTVLDIAKIPPAPMLDVTKGSITVPESANNASLLDHIQIRGSDGRLQSAAGPICFDNVEVLKGPVQFLYGDSVAGIMNIVTTKSKRSAYNSDLYRSNFYAEPLQNPGQVQIIHGPFDGKGPGTSVDVGGTPGLILAETPEALFWTLPENVPHGSLSLTVMDAGHGASFPVYVLGLEMAADRLHLLRGESTSMHATVFGPDLIPAEGWQAGDVSWTIDLGKVAEFFPGFKIPKPGEPGVIFLRVDNSSRDTVSMRPSKNETFRVNLTQKDFASGPYTYKATIQSRKSGGFVINGLVVAFFAPIPGTPLSLPGMGASPNQDESAPAAPTSKE